MKIDNMAYNYFNKPFSNKIEIFKNEQTFAEITFHSWMSEIQAYSNGKTLYFKKENFWKSGLQIFDGQLLIGDISFKMLSSKTSINIYNTSAFEMYHTDFWGKNWKVFNESGEFLNLERTSSFWNQTGEISTTVTAESENLDLLAIVAVAVIFIYMRKTAAIAAG